MTCDVKTVGNKKIVSCGNCQFKISEKVLAGAVETPVAAPPGPKTLGTVLSAEDTPGIRTALHDALIAKQIAKTVVSTENGFEALIAFHKAMRQQVKLDLLVLDVNMPILDGINLAVCIRAAEKAAGVNKHPILFFTSNICDDSFKRALEYLTPARYINKGEGNTGMEFGERLATVLRGFLG